jgi:hypothetical protein
MTGLAPCVVPGRMSAMSQHDCCDPEQMDGAQPAMPGALAVSAGPQACCLISATGRVPAATPSTQGPSVAARQDVSTTAVPAVVSAPVTSTRIALHDYHARSSPSSFLNTVLLI